ncbi:MAG: peptide/nickel transport system ATP-binding protein [Thermoanaerobacteraceae bacterium]|nr:peptide/nickel transport system ATP-binding protein [Thermoanaerobacteraceae bacterium]
MSKPLLEVKQLKKYFPVKSGFFSRPVAWVKAVDGVTLNIKSGEVLGLVGESGCGKTTLVNVILKLEDPTSGRVIFEGKDLFNLRQEDLRETRKDVQIVFQDPFWSLNPRLLIRDIIGEPINVHLKLSPGELVKKVEELLELVGLPKEGVYKYPHEFSGGQRQRIAIARALAVRPKLVVLDEPTSAIDVLSQAQILMLLKDLKEKMGLTYILISHDLSVVNYMADRIAVMYLGKIVEYGPAEKVFANPAHPYTKALFMAIPDPETEGLESIMTLEGNVPSAINPPPGCRFHTRCPLARNICSEKEPPVVRIDDEHEVSCFLLEK